jgi:predicted 2-oxoglutarate/Fe(II)-dependent dioxygenase YbiX
MIATERVKLCQKIRVIRNFVPRHICAQIVRSVNLKAVRDATVAEDASGQEKVDKAVRNVLVHDSRPVAFQVNSALQRIVDELIEPFYDLKIDYWEFPDVLIYPPGGFYVPHNDGEDVVHDEERFVWEWQRTLDRDISVVWYLNDDFEGGELVFTLFGLSIRPETGMVVTFPSTHEFAHAARPVSSGNRYVVATWMAAQGTPRVQSTPPPRVLNRSDHSQGQVPHGVVSGHQEGATKSKGDYQI